MVTTDLLNHPSRGRAARPAAPSKEEQAPAIAAAVERLAEDKDVDLLALAKDPKGLDVAELEAKLMAREKELEEETSRTVKKRAEYWRHIGALTFLSDTQKALAAYEKATALDPDNPEGWRYLGELLYRLGDYIEARKHFERLRAAGELALDGKAQCMAYLRLGWIESDLGNLALAEELQRQSLQLATAEGWQEGMAAPTAISATSTKRGAISTAPRTCSYKSLKLERGIWAARRAWPRAYGNLGTIYQTRGDLDRAEDMQLKCAQARRGTGQQAGHGHAYGNLGLIYQTRGDLDRAEDMQRKALKLNEELGSKQGMANAYGNLGIIYRTRGDLDRAEDMQLKALKLNEELGRKQGMANAYGNLGIIYRTRGDLDRAEDMQLKALKLNEELGSKEGMAARLWQSRHHLSDARRSRPRRGHAAESAQAQ